jgi:hypothetical protein
MMGGRRARFIPLPVMRGRGFGGVRGLGISCPSGQQATNMYDGSVQCCGVPGTPCAADPCCILNNPAYIATQVQAQADAISGDAGNASSMLAAIAQYPQNVQNDAIKCQTNPGVTFVDDMGVRVTCPSPSYSDVTTGGQPFSTYTVPQLAAMLAGQATPTVETAGNIYGTSLPGAITVSSPGPAPAPSGPTLTIGGGSTGGSTGSSFPVSVRLINNTGGSNSQFNVGDSWQLMITGPPNAQVSAAATQNGTSLGTTSMGVTNANGQLLLTGTMSAAQAGTWTESWTVGGQAAGSISFSVAAPSGGSGGGSSTSPPGASSSSSGSITDLLSGSVDIGGASIPTVGLIVGGLVALWLFGGRH